MNKQIEALAHAYKEVTEKLVGNQHKLDANDNGRIDADDFKKLKSKKKAGKDDPTSNNGETATMNPKSENKSTQESTKMSIRDKLLSVLERNDEHYKSAAPAEPMDNNLKGAGAKKMAADMKPEVKADGAKAAEDDAKAIEKSAKAAPKNSTDKDAKGDTSIINPVQDITKKGGMKESFSKTVHSIAAAYQSMYAPKEEVELEEDLEQIEDDLWYTGSEITEAQDRYSPDYQFTHTPGDKESEKRLADLKAKHKGTDKRVVLQGRLGKNNPNAWKYSKKTKENDPKNFAGSGAHSHQRIKKADAAHHDVYVYNKG